MNHKNSPYQYNPDRLPDSHFEKGSFDHLELMERRREHVIRRLAFVRAFYAEAGVASVVLYLGIHGAGLPTRPRNRTFVSATTNPAIAESLACLRELSNDNNPGRKVGVIMSQDIPMDRMFMTYMETRRMNDPYVESEAVLLHDPDEAF